MSDKNRVQISIKGNKAKIDKMQQLAREISQLGLSVQLTVELNECDLYISTQECDE